ncbi:MAG: ankyrin repeat domain-containing protein [Armatimonadota bacterium]
MFQVNHDGQTPLHQAAAKGKVDVVEHMLFKGAHVDARTAAGETPLHIAVRNRQLEVVHVLLAHGADINATDHHGCTPLHLASSTGAIQIAGDLALRRDANLTVQDTAGRTPLHEAAAHGYTDIAIFLTTRKADVNARDHQEQTPLHDAVANNHLGVVDFLLKHGADINGQDGFNRTPIHLASMHGFTDLADLLIEKGANVNVQDCFGNTPLHEAVQKNHIHVATLLLSKGADLAIQNQLGKTPVDSGLANGRHDLIDVLNKYQRVKEASAPPPPVHTPTAMPEPPPAHALVEKSASKHTEEPDKRLEDILGAMPEHIYIFNRDNRIIYISTCAAYVHGKSPLDFAGSSWESLGLLPGAMQTLTNQSKEVLAGGATFHGEFSIPTPEGYRYLEYHLGPIHSAGHGISGVICAAKDVTDRKLTAAILSKKTEELSRTHAEMQHFVSTASAELCQPLGEVLALLHSLDHLDTISANDEAMALISAASEKVQHVKEAVEHIITGPSVQV